MKTNDYIDDMKEGGVWSDCCSAEMYLDICASCGEHCEAVSWEEDEEE